jgi:hypothetical protein
MYCLIHALCASSAAAAVVTLAAGGGGGGGGGTTCVRRAEGESGLATASTFTSPPAHQPSVLSETQWETQCWGRRSGGHSERTVSVQRTRATVCVFVSREREGGSLYAYPC